MDPHRVGGVREPPARQRVRQEQLAEFIMNQWLGDRLDGEHGGPNGQRPQADGNYRQPAARGQPMGGAFDLEQSPQAQVGEDESQRRCQEH